MLGWSPTSPTRWRPSVAALWLALTLAGCEGLRCGGDDIPSDPGPPALRDLAVAFAFGFLEVLDTGEVEATWSDVATSLQQRAGRDAWSATLKSARAGLGPLVERKLRRYGYAEELEDAPPGSYFVLDFDSQFSDGVAGERVVCVLEDDEFWRIAGYFITER